MKYFYLALTILVVSGCSTAPRVGDVSGADYPLEFSQASSDALNTLRHTRLRGIRDLNRDEFSVLKDDLAKFHEITQVTPDNRLSSNAFAATSAAVGTSMGLALDYAMGIAILGRLAADDREINYDFSGDFNSKTILYSPLSADQFLDQLEVAIPKSMESFNKLINHKYMVDIDQKPIVVRLKAGAKGNNTDKDVYEYVSVVSKKVDGKKIPSMFHFAAMCPPVSLKGVLCDVYIKFKLNRKENPAVSILAQEIARNLPKDSVLYMPPRKDLYQLPMIYTTSGSPMFLVESNK
jgi:hypothetical protein